MVATLDDQSRYAPLRHCLACGSGFLVTYLNLGHQPLANDDHDGTADLARFPLAVNLCETCYHSQLSHAVDPELLFSNYSYVSGTSQTLTTYFEWFVSEVEQERDGKFSVLDIAGNDGTLLSVFSRRGHEVLNIDPAANLWAIAEANGVPTITAFWDSGLAAAMDLKHDVIVAMNVLGHVRDPRDFLVGCRTALADGGSIYVQTSQCEMVEHGEFDTIYHEHLSYFTARSFMRLAQRSGLTVQDVRKVPVHGTSYLWRLGVGGIVDDSVWDLMQHEVLAGYYRDETYHLFGCKAISATDFVVQVVDTYREGGYKPVGYGAAAKGNTVLNSVGRPILDCIVDENTMKVGLLTPGANVPIVSLDHLRKFDAPLCVVVLAWNFWDEVVQRVKDVRQRTDDVFVRYFPEMVVESA